MNKLSEMGIIMFNLGIVALICFFGCQTAKVSPKFPDPHHHVVEVHKRIGQTDIASNSKIVEMEPDANVKQENITFNEDKTFRAFTTFGNTCRIFIEETKTGKIYEVQGLPLSYRPFSDLVWVNNYILIFDRWSQPHYGIHYVIDMKQKKLIVASPFPDQFYLDQQRLK